MRLLQSTRMILGFGLAILVLGACASGRDLGTERAELGDFYLSHVVVVADKASRGPASRAADPADWEASITREIRRRFGRYDGDTLYHIAVSVDGYVLALPGIPLVASPKSILIAGVTVWDDAAGVKLNERPHRITVLESLSGETAISSGLTQSAEVQMQNLSENLVGAIERWMASQEDWFVPRPVSAQARAEAAGNPTTEQELALAQE